MPRVRTALRVCQREPQPRPRRKRKQTTAGAPGREGATVAPETTTATARPPYAVPVRPAPNDCTLHTGLPRRTSSTDGGARHGSNGRGRGPPGLARSVLPAEPRRGRRRSAAHAGARPSPTPRPAGRRARRGGGRGARRGAGQGESRRTARGAGAGAPPETRRRGRSRPGPRRQRGRRRPPPPAGRAGSDKGPAPAVGARGRGGCPAQAQTVAAPASGRPAASPHSRPDPSPVRPLRLTVPGRAHELVQQGPHLRLGGHGGRRGRHGRRRRLLSERWGQRRRRRQRRRKLVASASSPLGSFPPRGTPGGSASVGAPSLLGNVVSGWGGRNRD